MASGFDLSNRLVDRWVANDERKPFARTAILAAILLHAAIIAWLLLDLWLMPPPALPPQPVPVTLVMLPPKEPPPAPPEPPHVLPHLESGPSDKTTAPPPAQQPAPEAESPEPAESSGGVPPTPKPTPEPPIPAAPTVASTPVPPREEPAPAPAEKPKPAPKLARAMPRRAALPRAPAMHSLLNYEPGDTAMSGDPYLNMLWQRIEQYRQPTTPVGASGLHLEGISVFVAVVERAGRVRSLELVQSSGSPLLDDEAKRMIVSAMPFPPLPPNYPDIAPIRITLRLFPR